MRLLAMIIVSSLALAAQIDLVDPEYVIPKENPYTTPGDLERGGQVFRGQCARCHGPKGEGGLGAILAQPRLRHAADDQSLFKVIRDGIKGTEMPPGLTLTSREIWQLAAYIRSLGRLPPETVPGDPQRGQEIYRTKGRCGQCHILGGQGESVGPELTDIGARRNAAYLRAALLEPEAAVPDGFLQIRVVTNDGRRITGVRLSEDTFTIQLSDLNGRTYSFLKQDLKDLSKDFGKSPMPSYKGALTAAELDDLVAYLVSLRGNQ
jgi:putative heme-binding domain-containing protein